jgi:NAD(P) transhydrogenase
MTGKFDLIVIGSGPGGEKGAAQAAYFGKSVALIERAPDLGGAAANTGTLPSKTLRETALHLTGFNNRDLPGLHVRLHQQIKAQDFLRRAHEVSLSERERINTNLKRHSVELFQGEATFVDAHTIEVRDQNGATNRLTADIVLIATGSKPFHPRFLPFDDSLVFDSDTILEIEHMPKSLVIAGGGVIGCEYACMFAALGVEVSLVEGRPRLLGFMDEQVTAILAESMRDLGVRLITGDSIETVAKHTIFTVNLASGEHIEAEAILAATGRSANSGGLGLEKIGVETAVRGCIAVDEHYRTSVDHVYAVGDVIGFPALASTAMEQARVAMVHAFNLQYKAELAHILPYGIYTIPECSMAGETEESLKQANVDYVAGIARYCENARGEIIGEEKGFLKLLFDAQDMRLLGVHIIGEQASELVHIGLTAILMEATADLFIQTCFNYPTLSEAYKYATYSALGARTKAGAAAE